MVLRNGSIAAEFTYPFSPDSLLDAMFEDRTPHQSQEGSHD